ncbi:MULTISPECIES: P-type conjugative transfer protein VirB9 [Rhizobium/Agrobacterium group]|uniref:P-type conjugative transfer protein VirB9 n=2 Tax=Rhizobium/Agrobacterium group TaxID=227290 RepID=B9K410_ALLAM|nr:MULTISPECIES: P-type conjugative transfer protein VirB9 [Rhizobium/Agrobacterium group]ACM39665.1 P-type conjugative transfer protein VirB9 [Allorhizobium ampelinum S4]ASK49700.1 P-type conjugative transfer protein VirB9 [Agrobacterium vitis]MCF1436948.1 P-type conjugative transfer protein VirB9 [Allorhizobium ampelinum]MCF1450616.1 P-type conjugative transfer protein VirB9 [Allorhizobium ampelinum]MCF1496149.1 P-type conjugative transfer protein VirB9 [Allorhizobium ampelinum]
MTKNLFLGLVCILFVTSGAKAEDTPAAGKMDPRMRYLAYNPDEVVHLSTAVGATLVVTFGPNETVTAVAVSNSKDLAALPRGNYLFFKASKVLQPQPVIVLTASDAGMRRYVFSLATKTMSRLDKEQSDLYYSVQFTYPADIAAARRKEAEQRDLAGLMRAQAQYQRRAEDLLGRPAEGGDSGAKNWSYVAQGDRSLLPIEVFDNGFSTTFRFPGNVRVPSIYVINPDGKEATANYSVKGDYVEVASVSREWRLRDGHTVLCIWNKSFDVVGRKPGTGTVRPDVVRVLKEPR